MGTALVLAVLAVAVAAIVISLIKGKRQGKSSCGCDCAHCGGCSASSSGLVETVLEVGGMVCPMCESHINDAVRNNFSIKKIKSSYKTGVVKIQSQEALDKEKLAAVIRETGYELKMR